MEDFSSDVEGNNNNNNKSNRIAQQKKPTVRRPRCASKRDCSRDRDRYTLKRWLYADTAVCLLHLL
jgi:hypothetical protein